MMSQESEIGTPIKLEFYKQCAVGVDLNDMRIAYSKQKMIEQFIGQFGGTIQDAIEYLSEEYWNIYLGKHTPIYLDDYDVIYE